MRTYNDIFISYGRRHSKDFATKLHNSLVDRGFGVWFDQNDIPLGVDFQAQIDDGIEKADNFCFIISPHSVRSQYCLKEIMLAKKLKKRIIPILHVEPKDEWDMMDETISKLNWIYFREQEDDYDKSLEGLIALLQDENDYMRLHTDILVKAREWSEENRSTSMLLVGEERQAAEKWLLTRFKNRQAPADPTTIQAEFITESKKNANNLQTDIFISYDRENVEYRDQIKERLALENLTCWTDTHDIRTGIKFEDAIREGIEQADNVVFLITPTSIVSKFCLWELELAMKYHKRIIPILALPTPEEDIPKEISSIQYIDLTDNNSPDDLQDDFRRLLSIMNDEQDFHNKAKVFLTQGLKWERQNKNKSILLRGYNLEQAETWLKMARQRRDFPPLETHETYIEESASQTADLTTEVFVSYSRKDSDFTRLLNEQLQLNGKTTWFDQESIAAGSDFAKEIYKGIDNSDNFLFVISVSSIESPYCNDEVEYAQKQGKRIITVLHRPVDPSTLPPALAAVQWIDFQPENIEFNVAFSELMRTLDTDREHVQSHTKWQHMALEWLMREKTNDVLLRGSAFSVAEVWLESALEEKKNPQPTEQQKEFLEASRAAILADERRKKRSVFILRILLVLSLLGMFGAMYASYRAYLSSIAATEHARIAKEHADVAAKNAELAEIEKEKALAEKRRADEEKRFADIAREKAEKERVAADIARGKAVRAQKRAEEAQDRAEKSEKKAKDALLAAEIAKKKEEEANRRAKFHLYLFNGKELANKSLAEEQDKKLAALLALTSYDLSHFAQTHFKDVSANPDHDPEILESSQRALLNYEDNTLRESPVLALSGGTRTFMFVEKRNQIMWCKLDTDKHTLQVIRAGEVDVPIMRSLAIDIKNQLGAVGANNGGVFLSDTSFNFEAKYWHKGSVSALNFLSEQHLLISSGLDNQLIIYDILQKKIRRTIKTRTGVRSIAVSGNNTIFFSDISGKLWSTRLDEKTDSATLFGSEEYKYFSLTYQAQRDWLVAGTSDGQVVIHQLKKGNEVKVLTRGHYGAVSSVSFDRAGYQLVTASLDGTVLLWQVDDKMRIQDMFPTKIQYPDITGNMRKIFTANFLGTDYLLLGDNNNLRYSLINLKKSNERLKSFVKGEKLSNELWEYYIKGSLRRPEEYENK